MFGKKMGNFVNLGQTHIYSGVNLSELPHCKVQQNQFYDFIGSKYENFDVDYFKISAQNSKLDTIEIKRKDSDTQKYLVFFPGRGATIESEFKNMYHLSEDLGINILGFNYRGVSKSEGVAKKYQDLVNDGINQVAYLLGQGTKPENIMLYGECMGASIATSTASRLHEMGQKVYIFNDRSFNTLSEFTVGALKEHYTQRKKTLKGRIYSAIAKPFVKLIAFLTNWEMSPISDFKKIEPQYRDYIVIKSTKSERQKNNMFDDGLVEYNASLHNALKKERRKEKNHLRKMIEDLGTGKLKVDSEAKKIDLLKESKQKLLEFKERKMKSEVNNDNESIFTLISTHNESKAGHFKRLYELQSTSGNITGKDYLKRFVENKVGRTI